MFDSDSFNILSLVGVVVGFYLSLWPDWVPMSLL
jgi:hypothetical protein